MAVAVGKAMARFVRQGMKPVETAVYRERLQTCATCAYHTGLRCRVCGCFTNVKDRMPHERCPLGHWPIAIDSPPNLQSAATPVGGEHRDHEGVRPPAANAGLP
jgi:Family of unknown function (DUF6171)